MVKKDKKSSKTPDIVTKLPGDLPPPNSLLSPRQYTRREERKSYDPDSVGLPPLVIDCIKEIEKRGLHTDGILRMNGDRNVVRTIQSLYSPDTATVDLDDFDIHSIGNVLKNFYRNSEEPLLAFTFYRMFLNASQFKEDDRVQPLKHIHEKLPINSRLGLYRLILFLQRVAACSADNRMDAQNLATMFAPNILRPKEENPETMLEDMQKSISIVLTFIKRVDDIFVDTAKLYGELLQKREYLVPKFDPSAPVPVAQKVAKRERLHLGGNLLVSPRNETDLQKFKKVSPRASAAATPATASTASTSKADSKASASDASVGDTAAPTKLDVLAERLRAASSAQKSSDSDAQGGPPGEKSVAGRAVLEPRDHRLSSNLDEMLANFKRELTNDKLTDGQKKATDGNGSSSESDSEGSPRGKHNQTQDDLDLIESFFEPERPKGVKFDSTTNSDASGSSKRKNVQSMWEDSSEEEEEDDDDDDGDVDDDDDDDDDDEDDDDDDYDEDDDDDDDDAESDDDESDDDSDDESSRRSKSKSKKPVEVLKVQDSKLPKKDLVKIPPVFRDSFLFLEKYGGNEPKLFTKPVSLSVLSRILSSYRSETERGIFGCSKPHVIGMLFKRMLKDRDEPPILPYKLQDQFYETVDMKDTAKRIEALQKLFARLRRKERMLVRCTVALLCQLGGVKKASSLVDPLALGVLKSVPTAPPPSRAVEDKAKKFLRFLVEHNDELFSDDDEQ